MITQENQTADIANMLIGLMAELDGVQARIEHASFQWTNLAVANKINAFPTAEMTTTGGIGVPDTVANPANPINPTLTPGNLVSRAISANDIAGILTFLQGVANCIGGQAVTANGAAPSLMAKCL